MSDDQLAEQMNDEQLPDEVDQVEEQQEGLQTDGIPDDLTAVEQGQWEEGWRPENMFEGKPGNWKSAGEYKLYGEMQGDLRAAKAETRRVREEADQRFSNLNKYHEGKRQAEISDLKAQQRQAVEEADTALYDRLQTQIESTVVEPVQSTQPGKAPEISEWEARQGSWVNDPKDERTIQANTFYNIASAKPNATYESALEYVDKQLAKLYPEQQNTNPRRESATMTEQSRQPRQRQRSNKELSMSDLTSQEAREYEMFGKSMFKDEKQFLKSVQDSRKN